MWSQEVDFIADFKEIGENWDKPIFVFFLINKLYQILF